ncbi:MAG: hypothetical protein ABJG68_10085 [Crocinitomicaceae bacterium]
MKQVVFLIGFMFVGLSCQQEELSANEDTSIECQVDSDNMNNTIKENFTVDFGLDENNSIVATITPGEGAYFASPESRDLLKGYANLEVEQNDFIHVDDGFIESPASEKVYDSYSKSYINWVYDQTSYTYGTCRKIGEDFEVGGVLSFVIEPECSRYEVAFILKNKEGELSIEKTTTEIHNLSN